MKTNSLKVMKKFFIFCAMSAVIFCAGGTKVHADFPQPSNGWALAGAVNLKSRIDTEARLVTLAWDNVPEADGFEIYRSFTGGDDYVYYDSVSGTYSDTAQPVEFTDYIKAGVTYYYKIVSFYRPDPDFYDYYDYYDDSQMMPFETETVPSETDTVPEIVYGTPAYSGKIQIPLDTPVITSAESIKSHRIKISWNYVDGADGYEIYRGTDPAKGFKIIGKTDGSDSIDDSNDSFSFLQTTESSGGAGYIDRNLRPGTTYYYRIRAYVIYEGRTYYGSHSGVKGILCRIDAAVVKKSVSKKPGTNTITWKTVPGASGYKVYYAKKPDGKYRKLKTVKNKKTVSYTHKKVKNGKAYYYKVYAYIKSGGKRILSVEPEAYMKYCDYYTYEQESYDSKAKRIYGKNDKYKYTSASSSEKRMTTVRIKVWDESAAGRKFTRTFWLSVNKGIAPSVRKMFQEIYKSKERFPIHSIGCYNWRGEGSTSEHCQGTAFDINPDENYMIQGKKVLSGSFWKPGRNRYSIPEKCRLVNILKKYGFERGLWGDRRDYMHFSYFGT